MKGTVAKKGKAYYVVFRFLDPKTGSIRQKWIAAGSRKRDADEKLTEMMGEVHNGIYKDIKKVSFRQYATLWLESYAKSNTKASTYEGYEAIIDNNLVKYMGEMPLMAIDAGMLQHYIAKRLEKVKPKTVINEIVVMKEMFKHAVQWGYLKINPAEYVVRPRYEREEMEVISPDDFHTLLAHVSPQHKIIVLMDMLTGLRRGEILGLQWGDIDWKHNQLYVRRSLWRGKFCSPKSKASRRRVDLSPYLVRELKKHKLACPPSEHDMVFCTAEGTPLDPDNFVKREFLPALRRAGLRHIRFHDLRHSNVAMRIEQGQNIKYIQVQLGHASIQTTLDRYGHLMKDVNTEQAMKLDNLLGFDDKTESFQNPVRSLLEEGNKKGLTVRLTL